MSLSLTQLRANLYRVVDQVIATGVPIEIERKGVKVRLTAVQKKKKLDNLVKHPGTIVGNPDDLIHLDWSHEWSEEQLP